MGKVFQKGKKMKTLMTQVIVILILLLLGFFMLNHYGNNRQELLELGTLRSENQNLLNENRELTQENGKLTQKNETLNLANRYLKTDSRTARIEVLEQKMVPGSETEVAETRIRFTEFDPATGSLVAKPTEFTLKGDRVYVDALTVKFDDMLVETADVLKSRSLVSFQRIFGEKQAPEDGFRIDAEGQIPIVYRSGGENEEATEMEKAIWSDFWAISNDPERQKALGIRAIHGEAPSQRLQPGRIYYLDLRASGGLSFQVQ